MGGGWWLITSEDVNESLVSRYVIECSVPDQLWTPVGRQAELSF